MDAAGRLLHKKTNVIHHEILDEKKKLLSKSEVSIWLDTYDDIFSDFDPRNFSERTLSDDFMLEVRKMAKEKLAGTIELKLLMPAQRRHKDTEEVIVKNLHAHFHRHANHLKDEIKKTKMNGLLLCITGFVIMICAVYLAGLPEKVFFINALRVILEPAGWFLVWTGFDHIFYESRKLKPEFHFMNRMAHGDIQFLSF